MTPEERKQQSIAVLQARGIPYIDHLPVMFDADDPPRIQPEDEVKRRMIATGLLGVFGESQDRDLLNELIERFGARDFFSPGEQALIAAPSDSDFVQAAWRYEVCWLLMWALSFRDQVSPEDQIADVPLLASTLRDLGTDGVFAQGRLRPAEELLGYGDLIYRMDWACVDARINGRPDPAGLDRGVVVERHITMNWLTGADPVWDEVSPNT